MAAAAEIRRMHGIVLIQGLRDASLPNEVNPFVDRYYRHFLGGTHGTVTICRLELTRAVAPVVAFHLAEALLPERYYARLNNKLEMFVAFPRCVVFARRDDPASIDQARQVGLLFNVDVAHMRFGEMFELDHPEMHCEPAADGTAGR